MTLQKLNASERLVLDAVREGEAADLSGKRAHVRSAFLRRLMLGLSVSADRPDPVRMAEAGLVIRNGVISGTLNLDFASGPAGAPLPALVLENCLFKGGLSARHAHLGLLFLKGSVFERGRQTTPTIDLEGCQIASDLSLQRIRPSEPEGLLWARCKGLRIDGTLDICAATFRAPPPQPERLNYETRRYGLHLAGAEITGDISALGGLFCQGGLIMDEGRIGGSVWLGGATLIGAGHKALSAQSTLIDGNLMLAAIPERDGHSHAPSFRATGTVWLMGARIQGTLSLDDAQITAPGDEAALEISYIEVKGNVRMMTAQQAPSRIEGYILGHSIDVGGSFTIVNLDYGARGEGGHALHLTDSRISRGLTIITVKPITIGGGRLSELQSVGPAQAEVLRNGMNLTGVEAGEIILQGRVNGQVAAPGLKVDRDVCMALLVSDRADFTNARIGGSFDLTGFGFEGTSSKGQLELILKDVSVGLALKLSEPVRDDTRPMRLVDARERELQCYPGWNIIEALWEFAPDAPQGKLAQSRHLVSARGVRTLSGVSLDFQQLNASGALSLKSTAHAEEYARLFCGSVFGNDGAFTVVNAPADLPHDVACDWTIADLEAEISALENPDAGGEAVDGVDLEARKEKLLAMKSLVATFDVGGMPPEQFAVEAARTSDHYTLAATICYGRALFRSHFKITDDGNVEMLNDEPVTPDLTGSFPDYRGKLVVANDQKRQWATPPILQGMETIAGPRLQKISDDLSSEISGRELFGASVNLEDLSCGTLEDNGGLAWGSDVRLKLDRMTYGQAVSARRPPRAWRDMLVSTGRRFYRVLVGRKDDGIENRSKEPWEHRRNWLYQQFIRTSGETVSHHRIPKEDYRPQPFAEIIRVSRAMGDEEAAVNFEILKHRIEARHFAGRTLPAFLILGVLVGGLVLVSLGAAQMGLVARGLVAFSFMGLVATLPLTVDAAFRWMFGYLRRPINALATILIFFALGWGGVYMANRHHRLVVDLTPVASVAMTRGENKTVLLGAPIANGQANGEVPCGTSIDEALFALDVFIPLIDLRQESRCEVGVPDVGQDERVFVWDQLDAAVSPVFRSTLFWNWAKAIYAVAGWLIISLSILTFANVARAREPM